MTTTAHDTQAELDAQAYDAYVRNGENRAATARELGIGATTAYDRIKRHLARTAQDEASEPEPATGDPVVAKIAAKMYADEPDPRWPAGKPASEDPDESVTALLEDGEPETVPEPVDPALMASLADAVNLLNRPYVNGRQREASAEAAPQPVPAAVKAAPAVFPEGVITPGQFRDLLVSEGLADESLRSKTVCDWVKRAKGFPAKFYGPDGAVYDQQQKADGKVITKTGVFTGQARQWFTDRAARTAAKTA